MLLRVSGLAPFPLPSGLSIRRGVRVWHGPWAVGCRSLRVGKKECPSCRVPCASRRNLRKDPQFDELIGQVYPDLVVADQHQDKLVTAIISAHHNKQLGSTLEKAADEQTVVTSFRFLPPAAPFPLPSSFLLSSRAFGCDTALRMCQRLSGQKSRSDFPSRDFRQNAL